MNKQIRVIQLLVPTIKCTASTESEKQAAKIAIVKQIRKIMTSMSLDSSNVDNMHVCGRMRILFENGSVDLNGWNSHTMDTVRAILSYSRVEHTVENGKVVLG